MEMLYSHVSAIFRMDGELLKPIQKGCGDRTLQGSVFTAGTIFLVSNYLC
jgi:hypothetical protein